MFVCLFSDRILYYIKYRLLCLQEIQENTLIIINIKSHIAFYCLGEGWLEMCIRIDLDANTLSIYPQNLITSIRNSWLSVAVAKSLRKLCSPHSVRFFVFTNVFPQIFINRMLTLFKQNSHKKSIS